jgi:hypothetical protein
MGRQIRNIYQAMTTITPVAFRRLLAVTVLTLFVGVSVGRLVAPQAALFAELLPVVSGLLVVVMRYYFAGREKR